MCGRFNQTASGEEIAEAFELDEVQELAPRYNIAPTQPVPIVRLESGSDRRRLATLKWGLVPAGSLGGERGFINARAETAWERPSFREAFSLRRCLVPATGFYEWQKTEGKRRRPWLIRLAAGGVFAFAGLWEPPAGDEAAGTFTILTTEPNELAARVHDRMPVIVAPADYAAWLDARVTSAPPLRGLLRPFPAAAMTAFPVSTAVNNPAVDDPSCIAPP